jgi:hypothetical protein
MKLVLVLGGTDGGPFLDEARRPRTRTEMLGWSNGGDYTNDRVVAHSVRTETRGIG